MSGAVACEYCGGSHSKAAEVRACWERSQGVEPGRGADADRGEAPSPSQQKPIAAARAAAVPSGAGVMRPVLGRSVIVRPDQATPPAWSAFERVAASEATLADLEDAWRSRRPVVIEVSTEPESEAMAEPVWSLAADFSFLGERLAHAVTANAVDFRGDAPRWSLADEAVALGATVGDGEADVVLPSGQPALCDGGPIDSRPFAGAGAAIVVVPAVSVLSGSLRAIADDDTQADLADDQRAAVTHTGGAARIIAPAGSGKTRVLTERARHLITVWQVPPKAITLVAFNKRAADEMVERTSDLRGLRVKTLNALGLDLVNRVTRVNTIDERDVRSILDSLVDLPRRVNTDPAAAWIEALSAVRLGLQDPDEVEAEFAGDVDGLAEVLVDYREVLARRGVVDFDEQIYRAIEVLLAKPDVRAAARAQCRLMLVDEFQDLTPAHLLLVRLLAGPAGAVFGVGDDDQTIYGYSGASPRWLIEFDRYFPTAGDHPLEVNYRCPPTIVEAAKTLLTHNRIRVPKIMRAAPDRSGASDALRIDVGDDALAATVAAVERHVGAGVAPSDVAVLTRVNASLAPVQVALAHHGVPVRSAVGESYLQRGGVQAALAWLRLATSGSQRLSGADIGAAARRPSRGISSKLAGWMAEQSSVRDLERLAGRLSRNADEQKVMGFIADLGIVQDIALTGTTAAVLSAVRAQIGLDQAMQLLEGARRRLDRSAQTDDLDALVALASLHPDAAGFGPWLSKALRRPGDPDGVMLATIHSVKGREWPHVVLHDVAAGLLPHRLAVDVEEERRVFHVGLTRCSQSVTVVGGPEPSPFIAELGEPWTPDRAPLRQPVKPAPTPAGRSTTPTARPPAGPEAAVVEEALRAWRSAKSRAEGKPAYVYLNDETLLAIAASLPTSLGELAKIKGIGPAKLEGYGDELIAIVDEARSG